MRKTLLAALALSLFAAAFLPLAADAQAASEAGAPDAGSLTVVGNGKATAKPDRARVKAVASTKAATLVAAAAGHKDLTSRVRTLLQSLKDKGLELVSSNSSLGEDLYYGSQRETRPPSFKASTNYALNVADLDRLDGLIADLTASGLVEVQTVSFSVRDNRPALDEARRDAMRDGRRQAEVLAEAAGARLGNIVDISDVRATPEIPEGEADMPAPRGHRLVVPPQHLDFSAGMTIRWKIFPRSANKDKE